MNLQIEKKRNKTLTSIIIILASIIISFFVQQSNLFYKGDEIGNIAVFFLSFFIILISTSYLFREITSEIINVKIILGLILFILDITLILTFFGSVVLKIMSAPKFTITLLFIFGLFNLYYIFKTKFWKRQFVAKGSNILSIINFLLICTIYLFFIYNSHLQSCDLIVEEDEDKLLYLTAFLILTLNIIYPTLLFLTNKKNK